MNRRLKKAFNPRVWIRLFWVALSKHAHWPNSRVYLKVLYKLYTKKNLNLVNPKTFTEKIQWLKLYYNVSQEHTMWADKYEVRKYIEKTIGGEYLIPLLGVWDRFEDIDFSQLPNQFVLKTTHDSGGVVICRDKASFDKNSARRKLNNRLHINYYWAGREMPYKDIKPRIIAEKYMVDHVSKDLPDYKLFCFNGKPEVLFYASERFNKDGHPPFFTYYDMDLNILPIQSKGHQTDSRPIKIDNWEEMKKLATILSKGHPHLRVDFYCINGSIYFGEITFHHDGGFVPFVPQEWDKKLGDMIQLPIDNSVN